MSWHPNMKPVRATAFRLVYNDYCEVGWGTVSCRCPGRLEVGVIVRTRRAVSRRFPTMQDDEGRGARLSWRMAGLAIPVALATGIPAFFAGVVIGYLGGNSEVRRLR